jgi:hypothetical protein
LKNGLSRRGGAVSGLVYYRPESTYMCIMSVLRLYKASVLSAIRKAHALQWYALGSKLLPRVRTVATRDTRAS